MNTALAPYQSNGAPRTTANVIATLDDVFRVSDVLIRSGMLPQGIKTPEAAAAIILKGQELGIGAMEAFSGITVIQGKPTVSPQLMLSLIYRSGLMADMQVTDDGNTCTVMMKRRGSMPHSETFSMADAKAMQLADKQNWKMQPKTMRKWRCVAACARIVFPDVIAGMYLHDEMGADTDEDGEIIHAESKPVIEPYPQNNSGHGRGQYASPAQVEEYNARLNGFLDAFNAKFLDRWTTRDGVVDGIKEPVSTWNANGHLVKWAVESGQLDGGIIPENVKASQKDKYVAIVFHRDPASQKALIGELNRYARDQAYREGQRWRAKHPGECPECAGFAEIVEAEEEDALPDDSSELPEPGADG